MPDEKPDATQDTGLSQEDFGAIVKSGRTAFAEGKDGGEPDDQGTDKTDDQDVKDQGQDAGSAGDQPGPDDQDDQDKREPYIFEELPQLRKSDPEAYEARLKELQEQDPEKHAMFLRLQGLQKGFHEERGKRRDLERQQLQAQEKIRQERLTGFEELSEAELEDLKADDPDAYVEYREQELKHKNEKAQAERESAGEIQKLQLVELNLFLNDQFDFELNQESQGDYRQIVSADLETEIDKILEANFRKNEFGVFTAEQIKLAYQAANSEAILANERARARQDLKKNLQEAGAGGSRLDRIPPGAKNRRSTQGSKNLTTDDLVRMGRKEFQEVSKSI